MRSEHVDQSFLQARLRAIDEGRKEGVRREIRRLTELGFPIYVADNGRVIDLKTGQTAERRKRRQEEAMESSG